ncbi:MAG: response regulator, partial [Planctomycetales bacterium]
MPKRSLLLVDDDQNVLQSTAGWLRDQGYQVDEAPSLIAAITAIDKHRYDAVVADIRLEDGDGFQLLDHCQTNHSEISVIFMTGYGTMDTAIEAIRRGAFDFLTKPLLDEELEIAIERAVAEQSMFTEHDSQPFCWEKSLENVVGNDHRMRQVFNVIESVADTKATVLITGESGTGKSMIARAIHQQSGRRDEPFV